MLDIVPRFIDGEEPEEYGEESDSHSRFRFRAGQATIHNLNIPPACLIFAQFAETSPSFDHEFEAFRNAALC